MHLTGLAAWLVPITDHWSFVKVKSNQSEHKVLPQEGMLQIGSGSDSPWLVGSANWLLGTVELPTGTLPQDAAWRARR